MTGTGLGKSTREPLRFSDLDVKDLDGGTGIGEGGACPKEGLTGCGNRLHMQGESRRLPGMT